MNGKVKDMHGKRFERLVVLEYAGSRGPNQNAYWHCICDCGQKVTTRGQNLRAGDTKSCGCLNQEMRRLSHLKHGLYSIPEYWVWHSAKDRCHNPNDAKFKHYGGRGIQMCQEWRDSFTAFIANMGRRPKGKYTLDRIDNDGDYEPGNCRWATYAEQNRNNRRTRFLTFQGETHCLSDWATKLGMCRATLDGRFRLGWSIEEAFTAPLHSRRKK